MKLYLLRHGIAEEYSESGLDYDRKLTHDGELHIKNQTNIMSKIGVQPDIIITSPYSRASRTATLVSKHLAREIPVVENEKIGCGFRFGDFQKIANEYKEVGSLMIVGHNPDLPIIASQLIGGGQIDLKKGGLIRIDLDDFEPSGGVLEWVISAKAMLGLGD